jgi:hypothetical protein
MVRILVSAVALLGCLLLSIDPALAITEISRTQTQVTAGSNTITADTNVKFKNYTVGHTFTTTLNYTSTCDVVFSGLALRSPNPFAPKKGVSGAISNVTGGPSPGSPGTAGSVTFDVRFDALWQFGSKLVGVMYLTLLLGVDDDCNVSTGDGDGVDASQNIGAQILVTGPVPSGGGGGDGTREPAYVTLSIDPKTKLPIYECDTVNGPAPGINYYLAGISGLLGIPPSRGGGLPIFAPTGADAAAVAAAIAMTGGTAVH